MKIKTNNIEDTKKLAKIFAECLPENGAFVSLFGDIGAGKTALVRLILQDIGIKEKITSPSFVILNEYKGGRFPAYHFDLYRLENEGVETIKEELREYSKENVLTFVEWADFSQGELPYDRLNIRVFYDEKEFNDTRFYELSPIGEKYELFTRQMAEKAKGAGLL